MKKCKDCLKLKPFTSFYTSKSCKDGFIKRCKECYSLRYTQKPSAKRHFRNIYSYQKSHSIRRNHPPPNYSLNDLYIWIDKQPNVFDLWNNWVNSNYDKELAPSIDRINNNLPYELSNLQLVTWKENNHKGYRDLSKDPVKRERHAKLACP